MVKLAGTFSRFQPVKALVIGDFMLDTYTTGKVKRISPEAPVSILKVEKEESLPGGAGNVVLNLLSLGAEVKAVGRIGSDLHGEVLLNWLKKEGTNVEGLLVEKGYQTPVKNRLIADSQQILRVDLETITPLIEDLEDKIIKLMPSLLAEIQVVAISDYNKGFLSKSLISSVIQMAKAKKIPVVIDPKGDDFSKYKGATLIKPNLKEAYSAARLSSNKPLEEAAKSLLSQSQVELLLITRSQEGITVFDRDMVRSDFSVISKEVKDVTGAGDTVLAMISVALGNGLDIHHAAQFANIAAGISIERLGCARITLSELARRLLEYDSDNKIFDESHLYALQEVLKGKHFSVLGLDSAQGMTTAIFRTIRRLTSKKNQELIVYLRDKNPDEEFIDLLSSLHEVNYIILQKESLKNLCDAIHPQEVFLMESNKVVMLDHAKALLSKNLQRASNC